MTITEAQAPDEEESYPSVTSDRDEERLPTHMTIVQPPREASNRISELSSFPSIVPNSPRQRSTASGRKRSAIQDDFHLDSSLDEGREAAPYQPHQSMAIGRHCFFMFLFLFIFPLLPFSLGTAFGGILAAVEGAEFWEGVLYIISNLTNAPVNSFKPEE